MNMQEALNIIRPAGNTDDDLKRSYRMQCKRYHPDVNLDGLELMKLINCAYEFLKLHINKWHHQNINHDTPIDEILQGIINKIKHFPDISLEICGTWLWVSGTTKPVKDSLKEAGLRYAPKKYMWYWRPEGYKKRGKKVYSIDEIRSKYGTDEVESKPFEAVG